MGRRRSFRWLVSALCAGASALLATRAHADEKPWFGGLGYFSPGVVVGSWSGTEKTFQRFLGPDYSISPAGFYLGGGGFTLAGPVVVGGHGYGMFIPETSSPLGSAAISGGGGAVQLGWAVIRRTDWLVYPYAAFGGTGFTALVTNTSNTTMTIAPNETLAGGASTELQSGFFTMEFGVGAQRLLLFGDGDSQGGFAIGASGGFITRVIGGDITREERELALPQSQLTGGYLRLHLGGGGFYVD